MAKKWFYEELYNFETNEDFSLNNWHDIFETFIYILLNFQAFIFWTDREVTRQRALRPDRVG